MLSLHVKLALVILPGVIKVDLESQEKLVKISSFCCDETVNKVLNESVLISIHFPQFPDA